ncbi:MAG: tyrosine-type recombinase/integrase [Rhodanobacteraceae bacterium]
MLTPSAVANAKAAAKPYRLSDERAMFLLVQPDGSRWWRWTYRRPGTKKRNTLSLGTFPDVSLKQARTRRDEARKLLADGIDPGDKRKAEQAAGAETFEAVAREWFAKFSTRWAASHADKIIRRLERDVFPWIGSKPIATMTAPDVLAVLRRIESRGAVETAHRAHQNCGQVFRYAVATGRAQGDVTRDLRGSLTPWKPGHFASMTDPDKVGGLLRAIYAFTGTLQVACALKLAPLVFVRPGELRHAEWAEFNLDAAEWNIPADKMKMREPHLVPLSTQAVAILRDLWPLTGAGRFVFPGTRDRKKPLSNMAMNAAFKRMGFDGQTFTAHGFRAMARTILDERLGFRPDYIEHQLAHAVKDANGRAYNRTSFLPERRKMMQTWADYLDALREGSGKVVPIKCKAN